MFFGGGFPFENQSRKSRKNVDNQKFYQVLGINQSSSSSEIKKAYRKLAIQHHPDKGGDPETFKELSRAYECLSDPEKRKLYDQYGEEGLDGAGPASDPSDIFDIFFGGGRKKQGKKRGEDIVSDLKLTLEQVYNGAQRKLAVNRDVLCSECNGEGCPPGKKEYCESCDGKGVKLQISRVGPMIQQTQSVCGDCSGQGKRISPANRCKVCHGEGVKKDRKVLEVYIDKGVPNRHKITFRGEADQRPNEEPGDVVFIVKVADHDIFQRKGRDLLTDKTITLFEALTGYSFIITQLDGRKLIIHTKAGEIIKPGDIKCVADEGLPTHNQPFQKGNLFFRFEIQFPSPHDINEREIAQLKKILPQSDVKPVNYDDPECEIHELVYINPDDSQRKQEASKQQSYDEDDEDPPRGQSVQCRPQ